MKRQVVQDFLNLPGIVGIALIDERSHAHFLGIDQILNVQQKEILAQGIQQVVATTPAGLEFFSFQFVKHRIYIHKLEQAMILMVLTHPHLPQQDYQSTLTPLKQLLQTDEVDGAEAFSELVENIALDTELDPPASSPRNTSPSRVPPFCRNGGIALLRRRHRCVKSTQYLHQPLPWQKQWWVIPSSQAVRILNGCSSFKWIGGDKFSGHLSLANPKLSS